MAVPWRLVCFTMMTVNAVLMLATLAVAIEWFTQSRVPPSPRPPDPGMTSARVSSLAPPSTAESDVIKLTWETIKQAVKERQNKYQEAESFRAKMPQDPKLIDDVKLKASQEVKTDENLHWDGNNRQFMDQRIEYDERGYLHILANGFYFVYAHLHYIEKPGNGFDRDRLKDYIFRTEKRFVDDPILSKKLKKKLLFNEQTPCKVVPSSTPLTSSYQGAVVYLNRDDMLSVASFLPENLHKENSRSHFGVRLV